MVDLLEDLRGIKLPFDIDLVDPQCHECIRNQIQKYFNAIDEKGKPVGHRFLVPCTGIPKSYIKEEWKNQYDDDVLESILSVNDKVAFAKNYLKHPDGSPWIIRDYQAKILRCTARRKVLRASRRTGKTVSVCIDICYNLFMVQNTKILVAGPQKTHTQEIFDRVRAFIYRNPILADAVIKDVSSPYYEIRVAIDENNVSVLRGFAAGTKGKSEGASIRGQDADFLYLEEMDLIDDKAITGAILPILQTSPNTSLIGFSTPTGFKTPYRKLCEEDAHYKEFHYTYRVLPHADAVEKDRQQYTEEDWIHEFEAEFGSSEEGVYKPSYVERSLRDYKYADMTRGGNWRYCIGTDWNEKWGTEIVVLGYNIQTTMFQVVESIHVPKSEFTQLTGVNTLLAANLKWRPSFVYIDAGNGSTNFELLIQTAERARLTGGDKVTANLRNILKKYDSGSSIPITDPITRKEVKIPAKRFMVNASVRMFEQGKIIISNTDVSLISALRNYIIERETPTKVPVYGMNDRKVRDHRLDALNLAIVAFHREFDELWKKEVISAIAITANPRAIGLDSEHASRLIPQNRGLDPGPFEGPTSSRSGIQYVKTNRVGWESDTEDKERVRYLQRKRLRDRMFNNRPRRTNI